MEIHSLATDDGIGLHIAYFAPRRRDMPVVVCTHGVGNSFCNTPLWGVSHFLAEQGWGIGLFNNRGHDWVSMNSLDRRWIGAAFERIEDSALDFDAAIRWLEGRGHRSIIIAGHSLGGLKAAYTHVFHPAKSVIALAMFSSPRLPDDKVWDWAAHERLLAHCRELIAQGKGRELMYVDMPTNTPALQGLMCAETYVNKYGPDACTTTLRFADRIGVPTFLIAGTHEKPQLSFAEDMEKALVDAPSVKRVVIEGADHMYTDRHAQVAEAFIGWLTNVS